MGLGLAGKDQGWRSSRLTVAMERISPAGDGAGRARRPGRDRSPRPDGQVRSAGFLAAVALVTLHAAMPRRTASERLAAAPSATSTSRAASSRLSSRMAICVLMVLPADAKRQPNGMQPFPAVGEGDPRYQRHDRDGRAALEGELCISPRYRRGAKLRGAETFRRWRDDRRLDSPVRNVLSQSAERPPTPSEHERKGQGSPHRRWDPGGLRGRPCVRCCEHRSRSRRRGVD